MGWLWSRCCTCICAACPSPARLHLFRSPQLDQEERLAAEPPRLSKHRFQPMPLQVLTSDELAGSLRRLKPTAMLAKDR